MSQGDDEAGFALIEAEEQGFIEKLIPHSTIKALQKPFCMGLPGAMKCQ
jgi:hypothetical protein